MHRAHRHRSPTLRSALRQCCAHAEDSNEDLLAALQFAIVRAAEGGALRSESAQDAALTVAALVLDALLEGTGDYEAAVALLTDTLVYATA